VGITSALKKRPGAKEYLILDAKLARKFSRWEVFLTATNLLNRDYQEIPGIAMPGRWITAGLSWTGK